MEPIPRVSEAVQRLKGVFQEMPSMRLTLADGMRPTALGLIFGLAGGAAAAGLIRNLLYGVKPMDPSVFAGVAIVLVGVAIMACLIPAWRASRLDAVQALRME